MSYQGIRVMILSVCGNIEYRRDDATLIWLAPSIKNARKSKISYPCYFCCYHYHHLTSPIEHKKNHKEYTIFRKDCLQVR